MKKYLIIVFITFCYLCNSQIIVPSYTTEIDYVKDLQAINYNDTIFYYVFSYKYIYLYNKLPNGRVSRYLMGKSDGYWTVEACDIGHINTSTSIDSAFNYESETGTIYKASPPNYFSIDSGSTISATFEGSKIAFYSLRENRGGVWRFILDNNVDSIDISTYYAGTTYTLQTLFSGLTETAHTVTGRFIGDDPLNPPSGGTSRGWIAFNYNNGNPGYETFRDYYNTYTYSNELNVKNNSIEEFAFSIQRNGGGYSDYQFMPFHGTDSTLIDTTYTIIIDSDTITDFTQDKVRVGTEVKIIQSAHGRNTNELTTDLVKLNSTHKFNGNGLQYSANIKFMETVDMQDGYVSMLTGHTDFVTHFISGTDTSQLSGLNQSAENDISETNTYQYIGVSGGTVLQDSVSYACKSEFGFRKGRYGRRSPFSFIQKTSADKWKYYPMPLTDSIIYKNDEWLIIKKLMIGMNK